MRLPVLAARASTGSNQGKKPLIAVSIIVVAILLILAFTYLLTLKFRRNQEGSSSNKLNDSKLPSLFHLPWRKRPRRNDYSTSLQDNELERNVTPESRDREMRGAAVDPEREAMNSTAEVDRHTSVRSVMTLPPYAPTAREDERILGREGERAGIDTVVEFPETNDEEEGRRDDEMESLYQIRLARRVEAREREARRQERRDARARGDHSALAEIRRRAESAAEESFSQALIAAHQTRDRDRRVSSVQYGDLGVARHDGTRLRANSSESDHRPLLGSAASISGQSGHSRDASNNTLHTHNRGPSVSSVLSSRASDEFEFPDAVHTRTNDTNSDFEVIPLSHAHSRSASRVTTPNPATSIDIPREQAPAYEDPPIYESPVQSRAPQLPSLERLPSIQVTPDPTPVDGRPSSVTR